MRMITTTIAALGFVGAAALAGTSPASAQGIYFDGPGFSVGVGTPYHEYNGGPYVYRYDDGPYTYSYGSGWNDWD